MWWGRGGVSSIQELSGFMRQTPSSSCLSLPKWEHSSVLTGEHLQGDLIKMEMVEMEGGWGVGSRIPSSFLAPPLVTS